MENIFSVWQCHENEVSVCKFASFKVRWNVSLWKYSEALPLKINWLRVSDFGLLCRDLSQETGIFFFFNIVPCRKFRLPNPGTAEQLLEQLYPFRRVCVECVWCFCASRQRNGCQCLGFLTCAYVLKRVIAHRGFRNTVGQSALEADFGRKIPCCAGDLNPWQYWVWLFHRTFYQLRYTCPWCSWCVSFL